MSELLPEVRTFVTVCERIYGTLGQGNTLTSDERSLVITSAFELIHALLPKRLRSDTWDRAAERI
jgi:hypothetical protein